MQKVSWWTVLAVLAVSNTAWAQIIEITNGRGPSGTHFNLPSNTTSFTYEGTVAATHDFGLCLKVKLQDKVKYTHTITVINPPAEYNYSTTMNMSTWGLVVGNLVTFHLKGTLIPYPTIVDNDYLYGDVCNPIRWDQEPATPWNTLIAALPPRREDLFEEIA